MCLVEGSSGRTDSFSLSSGPDRVSHWFCCCCFFKTCVDSFFFTILNLVTDCNFSENTRMK